MGQAVATRHDGCCICPGVWPRSGAWRERGLPMTTNSTTNATTNVTKDPVAAGGPPRPRASAWQMPAQSADGDAQPGRGARNYQHADYITAVSGS